MIGNCVGKIKACKPADCHVDLSFSHEFPVVNNAQEKSGKHKAQGNDLPYS
jgi:hypothetical protein